MTRDEIMLVAAKADIYAMLNSVDEYDQQEVRDLWFAREVRRLTREECAALCTDQILATECVEAIREMRD